MTKHSLVYFLCMVFTVAVFGQQPTKPTTAKKTKAATATPAKPVPVVADPNPNSVAQPVEVQAQEVDKPLISLPSPGSSPSNISVPVPAGVTPEEAMAPTSVEWSELDVDFGEIKQGDVASHVFYVKNTGDKPLKISRVKPSCGCTTPEWTKEEILPGKAGKVEVAFDSKGKMGIQRKTVTVFYNTENQAQILRFNGEIVQ